MIYQIWEYCNWGINCGVYGMSIAIGHDIKSAKFMDASTFPIRKENIDDMFHSYFSKNVGDDSFVELHGELQRLDLRS